MVNSVHGCQILTTIIWRGSENNKKMTWPIRRELLHHRYRFPPPPPIAKPFLALPNIIKPKSWYSRTSLESNNLKSETWQQQSIQIGTIKNYKQVIRPIRQSPNPDLWTRWTKCTYKPINSTNRKPQIQLHKRVRQFDDPKTIDSGRII